MQMMHIRKMRVGMAHWAVHMKMRMSHPRIDRHFMLMLMMRIVRVFVLMCHRTVVVRVHVAFGQMQHNTNRHQNRGNAQLPSQRLAHQ